jgi:branched-chain amino acid transport system permease protein
MLEGYSESVAVFLGINVLMAFSLYIPMSAGLISLGQGGFMAIGAYSCVLLVKGGSPFLAALLAGGLLAGVAGLIVGFPALRIRGIYLIILTLGFGEIVRIFFLNFPATGGAAGIGGIPPLTTLGLVAISCVLAFMLTWRMRWSRIGRAMIAVHQDETAAEAMGVNLTRVKLLAFTVGAFIAGVAGGLYAHYALFIDASQFGFVRSADAFLFVVLGGTSSPVGALLGAAVVTLLPEMLRFVQEWRMTFFGVALVLAAIWRPDGLISALRPVRR